MSLPYLCEILEPVFFWSEEEVHEGGDFVVVDPGVGAGDEAGPSSAALRPEGVHDKHDPGLGDAPVKEDLPRGQVVVAVRLQDVGQHEQEGGGQGHHDPLPQLADPDRALVLCSERDSNVRSVLKSEVLGMAYLYHQSKSTCSKEVIR